MIETERLLLRRHTIDDFDPLARMWAQPRVVEFISGKPSTREQSWARLLRYAGHWQMLGFGYWAVVERETGAFVGEVGFADYKRDIEPALDGMPELGYMFMPNAHGKGYATEAARAAIVWAQQHFQNVDEISCIVVPHHLASIRVAQKCGFSERFRTTYTSEPVIAFSRVLK